MTVLPVASEESQKGSNQEQSTSSSSTTESIRHLDMSSESSPSLSSSRMEQPIMASSATQPQTASKEDLSLRGAEDEEESLQDAALAIPDSDALSMSSLHSMSPDPVADHPQGQQQQQQQQQVAVQGAENDTSHQLDWSHMLGLSGQSLSAATTATSFGFAAARQTTSFGINLAKRLTQGLVALPAMALDGAVLGNAPGQTDNASISQMAHAAVGGVFDVISTLALGGIDVGSAITGASLGAAASGVEGVRRALGSEVLKSLGAFSRLVKREWHSASDDLPPGGIPGYSVLGITQALTAWVCIQMVTREYYEARMLRHLEPIDLAELHRAIQKEKEEEEKVAKEASQGVEEAKVQGDKNDAHREDTPGASSAAVNRKQKKQVRILDQRSLPDGEGDLIGAEIGHPEEPVVSPLSPPKTDTLSPLNEKVAPPFPSATSTTATPKPPQPLTNQEAIQGLKRYSKLVLGVYGGVALAWLGSLPPDLMMQAAGSVVDGQAPTIHQSSSSTQEQPLLGHSGKRGPALDDEADFLKAAASLDLDDGELIEDEIDEEGVLVEVSGTPSPSGMPGGFDHSVVKGKTTKQTPLTASSAKMDQGTGGEVLFSADPEAMTATPDAKAGNATSSTSAIPNPNAAAGGVSQPARKGSSYSYIDVLTGQADADIFHRLGGLEEGAAMEGSYDETSSQAGSAAQRMTRMQSKVARPSKPRYYVVTDHGNKKIILVLRGSLSLGDIAIDLTCESANFELEGNNLSSDSSEPVYVEEEEGPEAAQDFSPEAIKEREAKAIAEAQEKQTEQQARPHERGEYIVHEGMYETAKEIGEPGRPVHRAVRKALLTNPGYNLDITGHSLGAGVSALLALMWASPDTCLTTTRSGLPPGRRTHAFCFAVPCVMGNKLAKMTEKLVTSYCHSYDLVCRLSLGAILDIRNACAWLAYENSLQSTPVPERVPSGSGADARTDGRSSGQLGPSGLVHPIRTTNVMRRAFQHQSGQMNNDLRTKNELEADFLALRKTLEANMRHVELYPPGVVLYSLEKEDLTPTLVRDAEASRTSRNHYLYRLNDDANRDEVFGQIIFERGMLTKHMPHIYHNALDAM